MEAELSQGHKARSVGASPAGPPFPGLLTGLFTHPLLFPHMPGPRGAGGLECHAFSPVKLLPPSKAQLGLHGPGKSLLDPSAGWVSLPGRTGTLSSFLPPPSVRGEKLVSCSSELLEEGFLIYWALERPGSGLPNMVEAHIHP